MELLSIIGLAFAASVVTAAVGVVLDNRITHLKERKNWSKAISWLLLFPVIDNLIVLINKTAEYFERQKTFSFSALKHRGFALSVRAVPGWATFIIPVAVILCAFLLFITFFGIKLVTYLIILLIACAFIAYLLR